FVVFGDRTGGVPAGLEVLKQAIVDTNLLDPDLVMTVGDLIQGYNETPEWLRQMQEYQDIMDTLNMRWFPVAGNHDVYWRGETPPPQGHHEVNYETHFGPLWYTFAHKNAGFIVLYSDEGDPATNQKAFNVPMLQRMSDEQLAFLDTALATHQDRDHVFVFLHHPRWKGGGYAGGNWNVVEDMLLAAGNVSGVFAGHIHRMRYDEVGSDNQDDPKPTSRTLPYYTLATTGGHLDADIPGAGYLHHFNIVTVRESRVTVASLPVGTVVDPKEFTPAFIRDTELAREIRAKIDTRQPSSSVLIQTNGSAAGEVVASVRNPCQRDVEVTIALNQINTDWQSSLDHQHFELPPGQSKRIAFQLHRAVGPIESLSIPEVQISVVYVGDSTRIAMPATSTELPLELAAVPADFFRDRDNRCVQVSGGAIQINDDEFELPDGPFTLEAWVKPFSSSGYAGMVAKTQGSEFALFYDEGSPQFDVHLDGKYVTAKSSTVIEVNQWSHIAGVFDGSHVQLFVNGQLVDAKPGSGARGRNRLPLLIGADPDRAGRVSRPFSGMIDEVRLTTGAVYSTAFTPDWRLQSLETTTLMFNLDGRVGPFALDQSASASMGRFTGSIELVDRSVSEER
ncbi:MAG: LamG-like jellyroll fold domain-containing protein, partial [Planctomycetota bacterium]